MAPNKGCFFFLKNLLDEQIVEMSENFYNGHQVSMTSFPNSETNCMMLTLKRSQ